MTSRLLGLTDVRDALRLAGPVVSGDAAQLAGQLIGRLGLVRSPGVARLLSGADDRRGERWFRPLMPSLVNVGGAMKMALRRHAGWIGGTAVSGDGQRAMSGADDAIVRVWDLTSGTCTHTLTGHVGAVRGVAMSIDGGIGVSGGDDGTVRVWDLDAGRETHCFEDGAGVVRSVAMSADGRLVVSGGDDGHVRVRDLASSRSPLVLAGHDARVRGVGVSQDGRVVVSGGDDDKVIVWDLDRAGPRSSTFAPGAWSVALDRAGSTIACGLRDRRLMVWGPTGEAMPVERSGYGGLVRSVAVTPDGTTVVSCSDDRSVRVWDRVTGREQILGQHAAAVGAVAVDASGRIAVSGSGDGLLIVWDLSHREAPAVSIRPMQQSADDHWVAALAVTSDGRGAVSRGTNGRIKTWDLTRWTETGEFRDPNDELSGVDSDVLALVAGTAIDGAFDLTRRARVLRVWDLESGVVTGRIALAEARVVALAALADRRHLLVGQSDGRLVVVDVVAGTHATVRGRHHSTITGIAVSSDGRHVLTASTDGSVGVWDPSDWDRGPHTLGDDPSPVSAVAVTPDARYGLAGHVDGTVVLWDLVGGVAVVREKLHRATVSSLAALADAGTVVSTSLDGTVKAWSPLDPHRTTPVFTGQSPMTCAAMTPDGSVILAGEKSGRIHPLRLVDPGASALPLSPPA